LLSELIAAGRRSTTLEQIRGEKTDVRAKDLGGHRFGGRFFSGGNFDGAESGNANESGNERE
jgi:hypothetical protein